MIEINKEFNSYESADERHAPMEIYIRTSEIIMTERVVLKCAGEAGPDGRMFQDGFRPTVRIWIRGIKRPIEVYANEHLTA